MTEEKSSGIKTVEPSTKEAKGIAIEASNREVDIFEVRGGKPEMEYYWGNTKQDRLEREKWQRRFEVCNDPNVRTMHKKPDGTHQAGDAILMFRPKHLADAERQRIRDLAEARKMGPKRDFEEEGRRNRIKTFEER